MGLQCPRPGGVSSHELLCNTNSHFLRGPAGRGGGGGAALGTRPPALHSAQVSPGLLVQNPLVKIVYQV